jgi:hypothetical protein
VYNITVKQYLKSKQAFIYDSVLDHLKGDNLFNGQRVDITQISYVNVKYCLSLLSNINDFSKLAEIFNIVFDISEEHLMNTDIVSYFKARNYMIETFKIIINNEKKLAQNSSTDLGKWKVAGSDNLNRYSDVLPLDQLAERYGLYPFEIGKKSYSEVFYLMAMTNTLNEVNFNYNKQ